MIVSSAGSSVRPAIIVIATPIASTGPWLRVLERSATSSTSIAATTVPPADRIAGPERATACCMASWRSSRTRSSSR